VRQPVVATEAHDQFFFCVPRLDGLGHLRFLPLDFRPPPLSFFAIAGTGRPERAGMRLPPSPRVFAMPGFWLDEGFVSFAIVVS
jgi:hypothetical protein